MPRDAKPTVREKALKKARAHLQPDKLAGLPAEQQRDIEEVVRRLTAAYQSEMRRLGRDHSRNSRRAVGVLKSSESG